MYVRSYKYLRSQSIYGREQYWYYTILLNPKYLSPAGKVLIESLNYFDSAIETLKLIVKLGYTLERVSG